MKKQTIVKAVIPAGVAAAIAVWLYQDRNMRSTKRMMVMDAVLRMRGYARERISRKLPGGGASLARSGIRVSSGFESIQKYAFQPGISRAWKIVRRPPL
jgi:hypothetical protein